jgi:hypothetical protein
LQQASVVGQAGSEQVDRAARSHNLLERHVDSIKREETMETAKAKGVDCSHEKTIRDNHVTGRRVIITTLRCAKVCKQRATHQGS